MVEARIGERVAFDRRVAFNADVEDGEVVEFQVVDDGLHLFGRERRLIFMEEDLERLADDLAFGEVIRVVFNFVDSIAAELFAGEEPVERLTRVGVDCRKAPGRCDPQRIRCEVDLFKESCFNAQRHLFARRCGSRFRERMPLVSAERVAVALVEPLECLLVSADVRQTVAAEFVDQRRLSRPHLGKEGVAPEAIGLPRAFRVFIPDADLFNFPGILARLGHAKRHTRLIFIQMWSVQPQLFVLVQHLWILRHRHDDVVFLRTFQGLGGGGED